MIFDGRIYKIEGASDYEDSSMFNGLIALFDYNGAAADFWQNRTLRNFIEYDEAGFPFGKRYVRHPYGTIYLFSRDQTLCLWAGFHKVAMSGSVHKSLVDGKDVFSPANMGHYRRCRNEEANWFQNLWLKAEILFHSKFTPLDESNQLISMMMVAGDEYLKLWTKMNPRWRESISLYWDSWRKEKDFGDHMIKIIENKTR